MNIAIINTTDRELSKKDLDNNEVKIINTQVLDIRNCKGCFECWTKTPGLCVQTDEMPIVLQTIMNSDLSVFVSDVKIGFISSDLKKVLDKTLPLIHPYFEISHGEVHHLARYDRYPEIALVLIEEKRIDEQVFENIHNWYNRLSCNMKTNVKFIIKDDSLLGGLKNEINNY